MSHEDATVSFNPCFNGYSSLTTPVSTATIIKSCSFNPCFNGYSSLTYLNLCQAMAKNCFNPCFNGYSSLTTLGFTSVVVQEEWFQSLF